jgi:hypothetical protein
MTMEHRFSPRLPFPLHVALWARGAVVAQGVCRDVSRDGMYVYVDPACLHRNALVEVEFMAPDGQGRLCLPAMVAHCGNDGIGLVFDELAEPQALRMLRAYLQSLPS